MIVRMRRELGEREACDADHALLLDRMEQHVSTLHEKNERLKKKLSAVLALTAAGMEGTKTLLELDMLKSQYFALGVKYRRLVAKHRDEYRLLRLKDKVFLQSFGICLADSTKDEAAPQEDEIQQNLKPSVDLQKKRSCFVADEDEPAFNPENMSNPFYASSSSTGYYVSEMGCKTRR